MELSDGMDIAAYSTANAQTSLMQAVGTTVLKKTMDMVEAIVCQSGRRRQY